MNSFCRRCSEEFGDPVLIVVLVLAALLWSIGFAAPFIFPHDANGVIYSLAARNHVRFGPVATRGANCVSVATEHAAGEDRFYLNHPGTLSLLTAVSFAVLGEREDSARLVPALFSLATLVILYRAVRRRWSRSVARTAAFFLAVAPGFAFYGKLVNFEPLVLTFGLLALDEYGRHTDEGDGGRPSLWPTIVAGLAMLVDWGAALLVPALLVAYDRRRRALGPLLAVLIVGLAHFGLVLVTGGTAELSSILHQGMVRSGMAGHDTLLAFIGRQIVDHFMLAMVTPIGFVVILLGVYRLDRRLTERNRFVLANLLWGAGYVIVFNQAAGVHEYWQLFLLPGSAVLFALGVLRFRPAIVTVLLVAFAWQSGSFLWRHYYCDRHWYDSEMRVVAFGRKNPTAEGDRIMTRLPVRTFHPAYYLDRVVITDTEAMDTFVVVRR